MCNLELSAVIAPQLPYICREWGSLETSGEAREESCHRVTATFFFPTLKLWVAGYQGAPCNSIMNVPHRPNIETMEMVWVSVFPACCIFSFQSKHLDVYLNYKIFKNWSGHKNSHRNKKKSKYFSILNLIRRNSKCRIFPKLLIFFFRSTRERGRISKFPATKLMDVSAQWASLQLAYREVH